MDQFPDFRGFGYQAALYVVLGLVILTPIVILEILSRRWHQPRCETCGTVLRPTARYCDHCGASLWDKEAA